ncbi:uncharacterized protein BJX67DRAFT_277284 [Aspergillus lucknowensis]|uniref:Prolyl 4-hydroxylase alpha subunit domain-containing protein n=1 Tax=Aspergillus lucknowensis TaxID=176173 RepID=A0ABR4M1E4_9EURO
MTPKVDSGFLHPQPPASARCQVIDFATTDPALPEYKNHLAAVIDNALTAEECKEIIRLAEGSTTDGIWKRALINIGNGRQMLATDSRNCGRIILDSPDLAGKLFARLLPFMQGLGIVKLDNRPLVTGLAGRNRTYQMTRFNERLRCLKYVGGEYFRPHCDAHYTAPGTGDKSYFTIHLYLNGEGNQDLEELECAERDSRMTVDAVGGTNLDLGGKLLGGATSFLPRPAENERHARVFPKTGSVLVFQQNNLLHSGDPVFRGTKYTLRTDVMYERVR